MAVGIVRTNWAGTSGGPGLTQIAVTEGAGAFWTTTQAQNAVNAVRAFWDSIKGLLPDEIILTVSPVVDIYNEVDGQLVASVSAPTPPGAVAGTATVTYAMASGLKMSLNTGVIRFGRRVRGTVFIVPAATSAFTATGVVASATKTTINTAGTALLTSLGTSGLQLSVYSRPRVLPSARPGAVTPVSAIETNEKGAVLRGRRD